LNGNKTTGGKNTVAKQP